jgi:hypothetical protein
MKDQDSKNKYPVNTILRTKDGRLMGNAIVVGHERVPFSIGFRNVIKTDYGNEARLTDGEIEELFNEPEIDDSNQFELHKFHSEKKNNTISEGKPAVVYEHDLRKKLWIKAWVATANAIDCKDHETATRYADAALKAFDERF